MWKNSMTTFNIEMLDMAIKFAENNDSMERFANEHGFSFLNGDKLIMPISMENEFCGIPHIIFTPYSDGIYFISHKKAGRNLGTQKVYK